MKCAGCDQEIVEGQHFMTVDVRLHTRMPGSYQPVRDVEPTVLEAVIHTPNCFILWAAKHNVILDVFGR